MKSVCFFTQKGKKMQNLTNNNLFAKRKKSKKPLIGAQFRSVFAL